MSIEKTASGATIVRGFTELEMIEYSELMMNRSMSFVFQDRYLGYWQDDSAMTLETYCEGDTIATICSNEEQYKAEQKRRDEWLEKYYD